MAKTEEPTVAEHMYHSRSEARCSGTNEKDTGKKIFGPVTLTETERQGALGADLPYKQLYRLQILEEQVVNGTIGPLDIFNPKHRGLLVSWISRPVVFLDLPKWSREELTVMLYQTAEQANEFTRIPSKIQRVRKNMQGS